MIVQRISRKNVSSLSFAPLLLLLLLLALLPLRIESAWTFTIAPYDEECFLFRTPTTLKSIKLLVGNYEVLDDGGGGRNADPLLAYVMEAFSPEQTMLYRSVPGEVQGAFRVPVQPGRGYWMCLQNSAHAPDNPNDEPEHPDHKPRMVGFTYSLQDIFEKPAPLAFSDENKDEWLDKSSQVETELKALMNHHEYLQMREADHRFVVEQTFSYLMVWSLAEALLIIVGSVGQVMYFRRFLERKRFL